MPFAERLDAAEPLALGRIIDVGEQQRYLDALVQQHL
jgi:hypothetical protein